MKRFTSYPEIGQYRNVVHTLRLRSQYSGKDPDGNPVYDETLPLPKVTFNGTVKLHGTNAGICFNGDDMWFQSRTDIVYPGKDNAGFATYFSHTKTVERLWELNKTLREKHGFSRDSTLALFGEWCGGSIQKGVAVNKLPKMLVIFGLKESFTDDVTPSRWHPVEGVELPDLSIHNIHNYSTFNIEVDLADPASAVEEIDRLTAEVERECPVSKTFGVSGTGEGIVWTALLEDGTRARFKSKGEKHSVVVKKESTPIDIEKMESVKAFVSYALPEPRLEQGMERVFTSRNIVPEVKHTGDFIQWVISDVMKEELDTMIENGLNRKEVQGEISRVARLWFFEHLNKMVFGK